MSKVIIVCGKICSGKSYYIENIKDKYNAVVLSPDEATYDLINNEEGEFFDVFSVKLKNYLAKKAIEIAKAGANVIYERGLWSKKERDELKEIFKNNNVDYELHYIRVDDDTWQRNIEKRNKLVLEGNGGSCFYLNEGLMKKLLDRWEEISEDEVDVVIDNKIK